MKPLQFLILLVFISSVSAMQIQYTCLQMYSDSCIKGTCPSGQVCTFIPAYTHPGGCGCVTTTTTLRTLILDTLPSFTLRTTTTTTIACRYNKVTAGCEGVCLKGKVCDMTAPYSCGCVTTTSTIPSCRYDTGRRVCVGDCIRGQECVEVAPYQCACSMAQVSTTSTTQAVSCYYSPSEGKCKGICQLGKACIEATPYRCSCQLPTTTLKPTPTTFHFTTVTTLQLYPELAWAFQDEDGDGVLNGEDSCIGTPNGTAVFANGCGCMEGDGGNVPYVFGETSEAMYAEEPSKNQGVTVPLKKSRIPVPSGDRCVDNSTLQEYFCNNNQRKDSVFFPCPGGCRGGACVCNDGDGGLVYNKTGTFTIKLGGGGGSHSGGSSPSGGGQVVSLQGQVVSLKNTQYMAQVSQASSALARIGLLMSDYCISDTMLKEFYCDANGTITSKDVFCKDACEDGRCIIIPNVRLLFVPVNWSGNQASFEAATKTQVDFFIDAIPLKDCREEIEVVKLDVADALSGADFQCATAAVQNHVDGLGINRADYDVVVGLTNRRGCGGVVGRSNGADTVWVYSGYQSVAAHELGHIYGLADQYCSNQAGSVDGRCNDGDIQNDGALSGDKNWIDADNPYDCPPNAVPASDGKNCCNFFDNVWQNKVRNCSAVNYGVCCLGNKNSAGGRSIMGFADVEVVSPGARAFDGHDKAHLATIQQLKCGNPFQLYLPIVVGLLADSSTLEEPEDAVQEGDEKGYAFNLTTGKTVALDLNVSVDGKVRENSVLLRDGRPTMKPSESGDYHLMAVDSEGNPLWEALFDLYYTYEGPETGGGDTSGVKYDVREVSYRIPYYPQMAEVRLYKKGEKVYSRKLDFCVVDGVCGVTETAETCPKDCRPDRKDKVCNAKADGVCDPDCLPGVDPDCKGKKAAAQKPQAPPSTSCIPSLPAVALIISGLSFAPHYVRRRR